MNDSVIYFIFDKDNNYNLAGYFFVKIFYSINTDERDRY